MQNFIIQSILLCVCFKMKTDRYRKTNFETSERTSSEWTRWETRKKRGSRHESSEVWVIRRKKVGKTRFSNNTILIDLIEYKWFTTNTYKQKDFLGGVPACRYGMGSVFQRTRCYRNTCISSKKKENPQHLASILYKAKIISDPLKC